MIILHFPRFYKIHFHQINSEKYTIDRLQNLEYYLINSYLYSITKITFYIFDLYNNKYKIILHNINNNFNVEIIQFNNNEQLIETDITSKILLYAGVLDIINKTGNLYDLLGKRIINPFEYNQPMI